jgi:hypothetical protein
MTDVLDQKQQLETTVATLLDRLAAVRKDGPEYKFVIRQLIGVRDSIELLSGGYSDDQ